MSSSGGLSANDEYYQQMEPCTDGYSLLLHSSHLAHSNHLHNHRPTSSNHKQAKDNVDSRKNDHLKSKTKLIIPTLEFTLESRCISKIDVIDDDGKENIREINNNSSEAEERMYRQKEHSKLFSRNSNCSAVEKVRQQWDNKLQFVLSLISYAVGLGNIWRFPYLCQKYGGGAFLIPYTISLIFLGIPLFYLELGIGQKLRTGSIGVWNKIHPFLGGMGISSAIVSFLLGLYYNVIIAWCIFYMINSFQFQLPWEQCPSSKNGSSIQECQMSSATSYFWYHMAIKVSSDLTDFGRENSGDFNWAMAFCLVMAWVVVFLSLMKGIKSSGKVMCFTAIFPYIVLTIFFIRAISLKGAMSGLRYMLEPNIQALRDPTVWLQAATQIFFSFGLAFGGLIAFASYNDQKNDCRRDTLVVSMTNYFTSLYAAVVIFAILGFRATMNHEKCLDKQQQILISYLNNRSSFKVERQSGIDLSAAYPFLNMPKCNIADELAKAGGGTGLAFITFTEAMLKFPGAPFWAVIFFLMLLSLGLGSMIGTLEGVVTSFHDLRVFRKLRKEILSGILCAVSLLIGFLFVTGPGIYWFDLFDSFTGSFALMAVALLENVAVAYVYGWKKFCNDLLAMTGHYPSKYWSITWRFISPLAMATIFLSSLVKNFLNPPEYNVYDRHSASIVKKPLPLSGQIVAISIVTISILPLPIVLILRLIKQKFFKHSPIKKAKPSDLKLMLEESMIASGSCSAILMTDHLLNQNDPNHRQKKSDGTDSGLGSSETRLVVNNGSSSFGLL